MIAKSHQLCSRSLHGVPHMTVEALEGYESHPGLVVAGIGPCTPQTVHQTISGNQGSESVLCSVLG